jgi:hypothetical protein
MRLATFAIAIFSLLASISAQLPSVCPICNVGVTSDPCECPTGNYIKEEKAISPFITVCCSIRPEKRMKSVDKLNPNKKLELKDDDDVAPVVAKVVPKPDAPKPDVAIPPVKPKGDVPAVPKEKPAVAPVEPKIAPPKAPPKAVPAVAPKDVVPVAPKNGPPAKVVKN